MTIHLEKIRALAADARLFVIGGVRAGASSRITVFDHIANKPGRQIDVAAHVLAVAIAGEQVIAGCADGQVRVFNVTTGDLVREIKAHQGACTAVAVNVELGKIATGGADGALREWSLSTGAKQNDWAASAQALRAVAIDAGGEGIAAAGDDGVVRVFGAAPQPRAMSGHQGPVYALAFTPRDGRLASAGDDGTIRLWYLVGDVESETRGGDDSGHVGAVNALLFAPTPPAPADGSDPGDRLFSAGADGKIKIWRLEDKRKPRTIDAGAQALFALAWIPSTKPTKNLGWVIGAGDSRAIKRISLDPAGVPIDSEEATYPHGFGAYERGLLAARPMREAAVKALAALEEPEALELILKALATDKDMEVRALAATELGKNLRREARVGLRGRLDDEHPAVRTAAFDALVAIERENPLSPPRAGLASKYPDLRSRALRELVALKDTSPLVPGLIARQLADADPSVQITALDQLTRLHPPKSAEPLRVGYERGSPSLKVEVLIRIAAAGASLRAPATASIVAPIVARALDDASPEVRRIAFAVKVLERPALAQVLEAREAQVPAAQRGAGDEDFGRAVTDVARRAAMLLRAAPSETAPTEDELKATRASLVGALSAGASSTLSETDLEPLLTAMSCRDPETATRGARGLARVGDARALGALLQLSRHPEASLRRQAAAALRELNDPRAKKRLIWMLDDADAAVRSSALIALSALQSSTPLEIASAALRSSFEEVRMQGLTTLVKLGTAGDRSAGPRGLLENAIEDEAAKVRGEAFRTLWSWHDKDPAPVIDRALSARFPDVRRTAVTELEANGAAGAASERVGASWALERLDKTIGDRDVGVAQAAYEAVVKLRGKGAVEPQIAALGSTHPALRELGARGAMHREGPAAVTPGATELLRAPLMKLLQDEFANVRIAGVEALYAVLSKEAGPLLAALQSSFLDLRVRAAELLAIRRDDQLINPMRALLSDKDLFRTMPLPILAPLRQRASAALATLGSPRTMKYFATELIKDEYPDVREQAARGMATACSPGEEGYLLDAMGHADLAVRSWAAEGLARRGDARALPVLTGTLRHEHPPIRIGAILSFAALGADGYGGMLQGLEDPSKEIEEIVFAIILARDFRAFQRSEPPDLVTSALAAQRPEVRFVAARAIELRVDPEAYLAHLVDVLMPPKPEKVADMKEWPSEEQRARMLVGLAEALAGDVAEQRYAAAQTLRLRYKPLDYFREVQRVVALRMAGTAWVPDTQPRGPAETDVPAQKGWLRRLFSKKDATGKSEAPDAPEPKVSEDDRFRLRALAFGAYVGLLRQATTGEDDAHRVRRDAIDRIVDMCAKGQASTTASIPTLVRALDDGHHLVRRAALAGLKSLFPKDPDEPLSLALASQSPDIARTALDELAQRGETSRPRIVAALNSSLVEVRRYAFELLERLSPKGSLDPLLAALGSDHADLRIGVIERLATSNDPRVSAALGKAMESDHDDLRLRAAELLAQKKDDRAVDVLGSFLRADEEPTIVRARDALVRLGTARAVQAMAARLEEVEAPARLVLVKALGRTHSVNALDSLAVRFDDEAAEVRVAAFDAALDIVGKDRKKRAESKDALQASLRFMRVAVRSKDAAVRLAAANELEVGDDPAANELLIALFTDRDVAVRSAAVERYSRRVIEKGAAVAPLEQVLRAGARELMLAAAEGVAFHSLVAALRPLLLFVRAGEGRERERALLSLGTLGDSRALAELEIISAGGTKEAPADVPMQAAAIEALGRIAGKLAEDEARRRITDRVEQSVDSRDVVISTGGVRGMRWVGGERGRVVLEGVLRDDRSPSAVRLVAATELGELGDLVAETALAVALDAPDSSIRTQARKSLDKLFPKEQTRVEFLAVGSIHRDIAQPAAEYLAREGDPALLVPRLAKIKDASLRVLLRYGLSRRPKLPIAEVAALFADDSPDARADAAWLTGAWLADPEHKLSPADRPLLVSSLITADKRTGDSWIAKRGNERDAEATAWRLILWAGRLFAAQELVPVARNLLKPTAARLPSPVRAEAARVLGGLGAAATAEDLEALVAGTSSTDLDVREASAGALAALSPVRAQTTVASVRPFDPIAFGPALRAIAPRPADLATSEGRRLGLPTVMAAARTSAISPEIKADIVALIALAAGGAADEPGRLDAVAALGRIGGNEVIAYLKTLAFEGTASAPVKKAAFRSLRRAQRQLAKQTARQAEQGGAA